MVLPIFPSSPIWANLSRTPGWAEHVNRYDSGVRQSGTAWVRALYDYSISATNFNEITQSSLHTFVNSLKGRVSPFLFKDPYDYVASVSVTQPTSTNMGAGSGFYFVDVRSWRFIPDSAFLAVNDAASGSLVNGVDFVMSQDNGWCSLLIPVSSVWTASFQYFRKGAFESTYVERSPIWNIFNATLIIQELLPSE